MIIIQRNYRGECTEIKCLNFKSFAAVDFQVALLLFMSDERVIE